MCACVCVFIFSLSVVGLRDVHEQVISCCSCACVHVFIFSLSAVGLRYKHKQVISYCFSCACVYFFVSGRTFALQTQTGNILLATSIPHLRRDHRHGHRELPRQVRQVRLVSSLDFRGCLSCWHIFWVRLASSLSLVLTIRFVVVAVIVSLANTCASAVSACLSLLRDFSFLLLAALPRACYPHTPTHPLVYDNRRAIVPVQLPPLLSRFRTPPRP